MKRSKLSALRQRLAAGLVTACVVLCSFFATINPPPAQAGGIQDTLDLLSQFAPLVDSYIAPASLTWLPTLYDALDSPDCSSLSSDAAVVKCADAMLAQPAAASLAGANVQSLRTVLELYLDVRSSDWGELFNDVFKLVSGGDPLTVVCKVLSIVTSGFPVCGVLELLYDVAKFAYEAAGAVLEGFKEFGCAVISFIYDCDDDSTKVGPVQFVADIYFKPRLNEGIQARTASAAAWAAHKKLLLDERAKQPPSILGASGINDPQVNQQAFDYYAQNYVYPAWTKVLDQVRGAGYKAAGQFVQSDPDLYQKLLNAPDDTARLALAVQRRDNCYGVTKPFVDQLLAAAAEGQGTAENLVGMCTSTLRDAVIRPGIFKRGIGNSGSGNDWLSVSFATMSVCETLRTALRQANPLHDVITGCGVNNQTQAGQLAMATLVPTPAGCTPYNVQVNAQRITCGTLEQSQNCNAQLKARYGGVGLPVKGIAQCGYDLPVANSGFDARGIALNGNVPNNIGVGAAAGLDPRLGISPAAEPPRCTPTPRQGVLQCPTVPSLRICMELKRNGRVRDCLPPPR